MLARIGFLGNSWIGFSNAQLCIGNLHVTCSGDTESTQNIFNIAQISLQQWCRLYPRIHATRS